MTQPDALSCVFMCPCACVPVNKNSIPCSWVVVTYLYGWKKREKKEKIPITLCGDSGRKIYHVAQMYTRFSDVNDNGHSPGVCVQKAPAQMHVLVLVHELEKAPAWRLTKRYSLKLE